MTIENVLLRDDNAIPTPFIAPVVLKTATADSEGFVLGVCGSDREDTGDVYNIFYGNEESRSTSDNVSDYNSYAACLTFVVADKEVLAKQLRELADLVESM